MKMFWLLIVTSAVPQNVQSITKFDTAQECAAAKDVVKKYVNRMALMALMDADSDKKNNIVDPKIKLTCDQVTLSK